MSLLYLTHKTLQVSRINISIILQVLKKIIPRDDIIIAVLRNDVAGNRYFLPGI